MKAHKNPSALRVEFPHKLTQEGFNYFLAKFNRMVEDAEVMDDISRTSRYIKPTQLRKQKRFNKLKTIRTEERKRKENFDKYYRLSVVK